MTPASATPYEDATARIEQDRRTLAALPRRQARPLARERLTLAFSDELGPAWIGTEWAFHGTSQTPGSGTIACGYYVTTLLEDMGLRVERVRMAQQVSEYIVRSFAPAAAIARFRKGDAAAVIDHLRKQPDGLYVVGMDVHVGLLLKRASEVRYCHSSFLDPGAVQCSDPLTDPGFASRYHVVGPVFSDHVIDAWLDGGRISTVLP